MYEYTLSEVFEELHRREFAEFDEPKGHIFSLSHRRAMKMILSANQPGRSGLRYMPAPKRVAVILLLIFLAILTATACTVLITDIMNRAPDNWITEQVEPMKYQLQSIGGRYSYSLNQVGEFMNDEFGIDPDDRTFTHEITDEQREWLVSRYDIEALRTADSVMSREFQNFLADLYYLGIFSKSEITEYCADDFDFIGLTGQMAFLVMVGTDEDEIIKPKCADTALEYVKKSLELQSRELYYFETDPGMMENAQKYPGMVESMREILDGKQKMHDILLDFFGSFE